MGKKTIYLSESQVDGIIGLDNSGRGTIPPYAATEVTTGEDNVNDDPTIADKVAYSLSTSGLGNRRSGLYCSKNSKKKVFEGGNRDITSKDYELPDNLLTHLSNIQNQDGNNGEAGSKRNAFLTQNGEISGEHAYEIRSEMSNMDKNSAEFQRLGGNKMLKWLNNTLERDASLSKKRKEFKSNMGVENAFIKKHSKNNGGKSHTNDNIININYE